MKIKRFDVTEYRVLQCGYSGGYYQDDEGVERAKLLMDEGIFKPNPQNHWHIDEWKFTDEGRVYYKLFSKKVLKLHGHKWQENDYDNQPDVFAYSSGYHNGYVCVKCGFSFCKHCTNEMEIPHCSNKKKE